MNATSKSIIARHYDLSTREVDTLARDGSIRYSRYEELALYRDSDSLYVGRWRGTELMDEIRIDNAVLSICH